MDISRLDGADSEPRSLSLRVSLVFCFYRCLFVVVLVGVSLSVSVSLSLAPSLRWCLFLFSLCLSLFLLLSACLYLLVARLAFSADGGQKFHICRQVSLECLLSRAIFRGRKIGCSTRSWREDMVSATGCATLCEVFLFTWEQPGKGNQLCLFFRAAASLRFSSHSLELECCQ